jgi:hypothetical protein
MMRGAATIRGGCILLTCGSLAGAAFPAAGMSAAAAQSPPYYAGKQIRMEQILHHAYATPKSIVDRAAQLNGSGG